MLSHPPWLPYKRKPADARLVCRSGKIYVNCKPRCSWCGDRRHYASKCCCGKRMAPRLSRQRIRYRYRGVGRRKVYCSSPLDLLTDSEEGHRFISAISSTNVKIVFDDTRAVKIIGLICSSLASANQGCIIPAVRYWESYVSPVVNIRYSPKRSPLVTFQQLSTDTKSLIRIY